MAAMAAVLLGWSLLTTVCFARCVELMAIARLVTLTLVESGLDLAPHLIFSSCLAALGALLLFLPFRGSRSHGLRGAAVGTLAGVGVIFFLCDGPLLYRPPNGPVLAGQTILITGANSGIGFAVGIAAAERGAHVLLACRSEAPCAAAAASMRSAAGGAGGTATPVPAPLDLSDLHTVRGFAAAVKKLSRHLDVLVLNAGFAAGQGDGRPAVTAQGIELSFGAMHVGHALLTDLLLPLLESSKHGSRPTLDFPARGGGPKMEFPARLVTVSSEAAALARPFHPSLYHGFGEGDLRGEITNVGTPLETPSRVANLLFYTMPSYLSRIGAWLVRSVGPGVSLYGGFGEGDLRGEMTDGCGHALGYALARGEFALLHDAELPIQIGCVGCSRQGKGESRGKGREVGVGCVVGLGRAIQEGRCASSGYTAWWVGCAWGCASCAWGCASCLWGACLCWFI
jgi:NAD(P)-dependent dehydrogenase (short-subunit alcohol dehydrogenase family)